MGGRNPPWGAPGPSGERRLLGPPLLFYRLLRGSKKLTPVRERQEGRERQSRKKASEISGPQPRGGAGARGARGRGRRPRARWIRIGIPRRAAGCVPAPFPARGSARGQWRIVRPDTPGGAAPSGLGAAPPRFACAPVTKVQGQERGAAEPRPAQALFFAPGGGNSSPPAPGQPLRVKGRAPPPPSEALCVSARPAGPARDVPARPAQPPRQRPSPMLISLAARPGGRPGGRPRAPCQEALSLPRRPRRPSSPLPGVPHSPRFCRVPCPSPPPPLRPRDLPSSRAAGGKGRPTVLGVAGQGAERGGGPCPRADRPLGAARASSPGFRFAEQSLRLPWKVSRGPSGPGCVFLQAWGSGVLRPLFPGSGLFCSRPDWQPGALGQPLLLKAEDISRTDCVALWETPS